MAVTLMKRVRWITNGRDQVVLATILGATTWFEFKPLFLLIKENLRGRKALTSGEEMLRLRAYEKLADLVQHGFAERDGCRFRGIPDQLSALQEYIESRRLLREDQRVTESTGLCGSSI